MKTLTEEVLCIVSGLSTARQVWKALEEVFAQDTKDREGSLITKLYTCKKENISISDYLKHFESI